MRENEEEPQDAHAADAEDAPQGGEGGVTQSAHGAGGDFKESAEGLPQENDEEAHAGGFDDVRVCGKESGGVSVVQGGGKGNEKACQEGEPQAVEKYFFTAEKLAGSETLAGEGGGGQCEGIDQVVHEVFVADDDGISRYHGSAELIDGRLDEYIGEAEDGVLQGGGDADAKNAERHGGIKGELREGKMKGPV